VLPEVPSVERSILRQALGLAETECSWVWWSQGDALGWIGVPRWGAGRFPNCLSILPADEAVSMPLDGGE